MTLIEALSPSAVPRTPLAVAESEHCSAFLKPSFDDAGTYTGMMAGHATWGQYRWVG